MKQLYLFLAITLISALMSIQASESVKRAAILISSHGTVDKPKLSYDLEELAQSYLVLLDNGFEIDIVSPKGGAVLVKNNKDSLDYIQRFKGETPALLQLANTLATDKIQAANYDALMIIGGDGAMFDLPVHAATQDFISQMVNADKPVAAVCHGPAALVNIKDGNGEYFVKGKSLNSFTNLEEQAFGKDIIPLLPFMLEAKLRERGAAFVNNSPMLPFVAVDGHLVTAQNPGSVASATEALILMLQPALTPRTLFKDEATLRLLALAHATGPAAIDTAMATSPDAYDVNYLALYGFYSFDLAQTQADKSTALAMMAHIGRHFSHPAYLSKLIEAQLELGRFADAASSLAELKAKFPEHEGIAELTRKLQS